MVYKQLVDFIIAAKYRGFNEYQIIEPLLREGWALKDVEQALAYTKKSKSGQNKSTKIDVVLQLDSEVIDVLERRAKKNKLSLKEQMEDILRRSAVNKPFSTTPEKLDDPLVGIFSRRKRPDPKW